MNYRGLDASAARVGVTTLIVAGEVGGESREEVTVWSTHLGKRFLGWRSFERTSLSAEVPDGDNQQQPDYAKSVETRCNLPAASD